MDYCGWLEKEGAGGRFGGFYWGKGRVEGFGGGEIDVR